MTTRAQGAADVRWRSKAAEFGEYAPQSDPRSVGHLIAQTAEEVADILNWGVRMVALKDRRFAGYTQGLAELATSMWDLLEDMQRHADELGVGDVVPPIE